MGMRNGSGVQEVNMYDYGNSTVLLLGGFSRSGNYVDMIMFQLESLPLTYRPYHLTGVVIRPAMKILTILNHPGRLSVIHKYSVKYSFCRRG